MTDAILTLNAGSSSIKFALFGAQANLPRLAAGGVSGIGETPHLRIHDEHGTMIFDKIWDAGGQRTHEDLLTVLLDWVDTHLSGDELIAAGHRIVHGGETFFAPALLTETTLDELATLNPLAPLHEPHNLAAVRALLAVRTDLTQIGCFDTAFHHNAPEIVTRMPIPRHYFNEGIRRYGFHGLSYEYISRRLREVSPRLAGVRVIAAHLGNGASVCAMTGGVSVDSSMGMTALDGLMMGTRSGSLDPGAVLYFLQGAGMTADQVTDMLYKKSGLLGVSGISSDVQILEASTAPEAADAIALFVCSAARQIGGLIPSLGGLDGLVFTAGIGEHSPKIRAAICARLTWLGIIIDTGANDRNEALISGPDSVIEVRVIPTDEEAMIARHCLEFLAERSA